VTTTLNDRHVASLPGGLINSLSVTGTLFTPMDKPAADANNAWRGIPGPRVATLVPNYTRIPILVPQQDGSTADEVNWLLEVASQFSPPRPVWHTGAPIRSGAGKVA
jgi:hypothetical protein